MSTVFIVILAIVGVSAAIFAVLRKTQKISEAEVEPLGYETTPVLEPIVETIEKKKPGRPKASKNTAKNKSLAKMEAKSKKSKK